MQDKNYDPNFTRNETADKNGVVWYPVSAKPFSVYGVMTEGEIITARMPLSAAEAVSEGVAGLSRYSAGGRVRFATDSPFVAVKAVYGKGHVATVCNHCISYGFDLYSCQNGVETFVDACRPPNEQFTYETGEFKVNTRNHGNLTCYTLNFPHFTQIRELYLGFDKHAAVSGGYSYRNSDPVVFYGSSITHGAAAGRPGNTYESFISQKYNLDYVNLGFAGCAKGETAMANYLAGLSMCAFVCDYDHNAPDAAHLQATHFPLYETVRAKHPDIPYIMISKPDCFRFPEKAAARRQVIRSSYEKARALGDSNVYFIDGGTLFDGEFSQSCTSDGVHPNDLGFFRMAQKIGPVIASALHLQEDAL